MSSYRNPRPKPGKTPRYPAPASGRCWLCNRSTRWGRYGVVWHGKAWCWRHHPMSPYRNYGGNPGKRPRSIIHLRAEDEKGAPWAHRFGNSAVHPDTAALPKAKRVKAEREIDAKLGRKKRKPARPRREPRDRRYTR